MDLPKLRFATSKKDCQACAPHVTSLGSRAEACAPATALRDLEWNNVRALIETGGTLWHERANWRGSYIVPKDNVSPCLRGSPLVGRHQP